MSFGRFNTLRPKPEHVTAVMAALKGEDLLSPQDVAKRAKLSLTQTNCALDHLEGNGSIHVVRQNQTPKVRVGLRSRKKS